MKSKEEIRADVEFEHEVTHDESIRDILIDIRELLRNLNHK